MANIVAFLVVLGVLVSFHEFGHLIVAKACNIKIDSYSVGFGPVLAKFKFGETEYRLSLIPLGGYVKPAGPNFRDDVNPDDPEKERYLVSAPTWKRASMIAAGPFFNLLLAFLMVTGVVYYHGSIVVLSGKIGEVAANSPASKAGLLKGDVIKAVNGEEVGEWMDALIPIQESNGREIKFTVEREGVILDIKIVPETKENRFFVGIGPVIEEKKINGFGAVQEGVLAVHDGISLQAVGMWHILTGKLSTKNLGGPIMIYQETGKAAKAGFSALFSLTVMLSIALGFFNLLPIPILDGGHLLMMGLEGVFGNFSKEAHTLFQQVGMVLILFIFCFAIYNDISRLRTK